MSSTGACATASCVLRWRSPRDSRKTSQRGRQPEVNAFIDAAVPFRAETNRAYIENVQNLYDQRLRDAKGLPPASKPIKLQARALFNQAFKSIYAMVPGDIMLLLILIPSMLTALSVVREKELGSIANFYAAPATRVEFLLGKQLPYLAVSLIQFATLVALAVLLFQVPIKGSWATLLAGRHRLRSGQHRVRSADLGLRDHADGGDLCRRHHHHPSRHAIFRHVRAGVFAHRRGVARRQDLSQHLLPGDQRRDLHQGARIRHRCGRISSRLR